MVVLRGCALWLLCLGLLGACTPSPSAFTDKPAHRAQAERAARDYLKQHAVDLTGTSSVTVRAARIHGGSLRGISKLAFEVRLTVQGAKAVKDVVVYVHDEAMTVAGAQGRSSAGAIIKKRGGRLDRRFRSRD